MGCSKDQTQFIVEYEKLAFQASRIVFFNPSPLLNKLEDELYGTRADENQLKIFSVRKAVV